MAKKKKKNQIQGGAAKTTFLGTTAGHGTFKDVQRKAIVLGMPFTDVLNSDFGKLESFIIKTTNHPNPKLLDEYDEWMDKQLEAIGYEKNHPMRDYRLRLGFLGEKTEEGEQKRKRVRGIPKPKEKKVKRERDANNLIKGTKKSYTFELTAKGYDLERVKRRVLKRFPEANEKSIKLWHTAAKRKLKNNG